MSDKLYAWRWWIWGALVMVWTVALLGPAPPHGALDTEDFVIDIKLILGKGLHLSAYAFLTILAGWLRAPVRYRFALMFTLMAHATLTEVLQLQSYDLFGRMGSLYDVALDNIGIGIGMALAWKWWTEETA